MPVPGFALIIVLSVGSSFASSQSPFRVVGGTGRSGFGGSTYHSYVHGFAIETTLNGPWGIALDTSADLLYLSDSLNNVVRSTDLRTGLMEVIAGTGNAGFAGHETPAVTARLNLPTGLVLDGSRQVLYVSDTNNHCVREIGLHAGRAYQAEEDGSVSFASRADGPELWVSCPNDTHLEHDPTLTPLLLGSKFCFGSTGSGKAVFVHAIGDRLDFHVDGSAGAAEYELRFRYSDRYDELHAAGHRRLRLYVNGEVVTHELAFLPTGLSQDGQRDVFRWAIISVVLEPGENVVRLETIGFGGPHVDLLYVVPPRPPIRTVAGTGLPGPANHASSQPAATATLHTPLGLALDEQERLLYIADADNGCVRRLNLVSGSISTLAGGGASSRDGEAAATGKLFRPVGLVLDAAHEYLYIADAVEARVRRVDLTSRSVIGGTVITVCGFGPAHSPFEMTLRSPQDLALDEDSSILFVADRESGRIRAVNLSTGICPNQVAARLECAHEGISSHCEALGCCFDGEHPDCTSQLNPDGRSPLGFQPLDVLTRIDGMESSPPISFVAGRSGRCCYPKLRETETLEVLDSPMGLAWDHRDRSLYVTQPKRQRVVKLLLDEGRCSAGSIGC